MIWEKPAQNEVLFTMSFHDYWCIQMLAFYLYKKIPLLWYFLRKF